MMFPDPDTFGLGASKGPYPQTNTIRFALAQVRRRAGLTQAEAALRIGLAGLAWSLWEGGKAIPKVANLERVAAVFDESLVWLLISRDNTMGVDN